MSEPVNQARYIVTKLGGPSAVMRAMGWNNHATASAWMRSGWIPWRQIPGLIRAAREIGVEITADEWMAAAFQLADEPDDVAAADDDA